MSLRITPENTSRTQVNPASFGTGAPSVQGLHDTMRDGQLNIESQLNGRHPLQARLENWEETQMNMRMQNYKRTFGMGEPIRRTMEMQIVKETTLMPAVVGTPANIHLDILKNKDLDVDWEDVYTGDDQPLDFHSELEKRMGI
ncbi:YALIA101S05e13388g1_1 [Yarrowia lipolytica]|nr:hypothetical protein YALI1_E16076g [Yarrowia lipolytica]QNP98952.1 Proteasome maturation factor UMP1 [Yarrowia lipolytica]SEI34901.1 YALIA101S05e13388g1_1 [Yarrowia lipolytica]VBB78771.1 Chaperone required for correct maturation of the 20S proteasome, putative [Yarrowia lipolytica]